MYLCIYLPIKRPGVNLYNQSLQDLLLQLQTERANAQSLVVVLTDVEVW